jgi:hypothetical protein
VVRNCRLLLAIPLDQRTFFARAEADPGGFAAAFRAQRRLLSDHAVWEAYAAHARLVCEIVADVRRHGVTVVTDAALPDFAAAAHEAAVVTLVAHWRSPAFLESDFHETQALADAWRDPGHPANPLLRNGAAGDVPAPPAQIVARLNTVHADAVPPGRTAAIAHARKLVGREYRLLSSRQALERALGETLAGGAAVEFAAGFSPLADVIGVLDPTCTALFDLTICHSVLLGEEIRRRCRGAVVMMNAEAAAADIRLAMYRQIIRLMVKRGWSYQEAALRLRAAIKR